MLPSYADIRALTDAEPLWFDRKGVPRYAPFEPGMLGVYDVVAVLAEIECQSCGKRLLLGEGLPRYSVHVVHGGTEVVEHSLEHLSKGFVFGDPPRHACPGAGETMSSIERRIVEAWQMVDSAWTRQPEFEIGLD